MQSQHRGAPAGNKNAVKHGFYCKELNKEDRSQFKKAANIFDIAQEIALLRFEIQKATSTGEISKLIPLSKAAYALEKLIRTQQKIFGSQNKIEDALRNVIMYGIAPILNSSDALQFLNYHYYHSTPEPDVVKAIQKQITPQNEADLTYNKNQSPEST
jgi:hypothetical protein